MLARERRGELVIREIVVDPGSTELVYAIELPEKYRSAATPEAAQAILDGHRYTTYKYTATQLKWESGITKRMRYLEQLKKDTPAVLAAERDLARYARDRTDLATVRLRNQLVMRHAKLLVWFYGQDRVKRARFDNHIGMERSITRMVHGLLDMKAPPRIQQQGFVPHEMSHIGLW